MDGRSGAPIQLIFLVTFVLSCVACQSPQRTVPALYATMPTFEEPSELKLMEVRTPPPTRSFAVSITIPHEEKVITKDDAVMRAGAMAIPGASAVIGPPASEQGRLPEPRRTSPLSEPMLEYRTIGYFHRIEQYLERGLLGLGLHVRDRTKFEADLRDLLDIPPGQDTPLMLTDIPEAIRSVRATGLDCDYILQVNEVSLGRYEGEPIQLGNLPEVQTALRENPGLRIGEEGNRNVIPRLIRQPWLQARLNAKLIDVNTGSIDWIGEYTLESLNILDAGLQIRIDIRKRPTNATRVVRAAEEHNRRLQDAHERAVAARRNLENAYREAMREIAYTGTIREYELFAESHQAERQAKVSQAEDAYEHAIAAYRSVVQQRLCCFGPPPSTPPATPWESFSPEWAMTAQLVCAKCAMPAHSPWRRIRKVAWCSGCPARPSTAAALRL